MKFMNATLRFFAGTATAFLFAIALAGCGPNQQELAAFAEQKRIECIDKVCYGDNPPKVKLDEVVQKLNGQWYVGPREYFNGFSAAAFYWPSKTPAIGLPNGEPYPEKGKPFYEIAIEIFFTGGRRWSMSMADQPWEPDPLQTTINRLQASGFRSERNVVSPSLEVIRFYGADNKPYRKTYYVATQETRIRGEGRPVASCDSEQHPRSGCSGGEFWQPDVAVDFRFNAKHAQDWPAIHQEIVRVLGKLQKAQPELPKP